MKIDDLRDTVEQKLEAVRVLDHTSDRGVADDRVEIEVVEGGFVVVRVELDEVVCIVVAHYCCGDQGVAERCKDMQNVHEVHYRRNTDDVPALVVHIQSAVEHIVIVLSRGTAP